MENDRTELDRRLEAFLKEEEGERRAGNTKEAISKGLFNLNERLNKETQAIRTTLRSHDRRLESLEAERPSGKAGAVAAKGAAAKPNVAKVPTDESMRERDNRVERLEEKIEELEEDVERSGAHNLEAMVTAARAEGIALGKKHLSEPPMGIQALKFLTHPAAKWVYIALATVVGFLARHFGLKP